jgi:hypothetical protein
MKKEMISKKRQPSERNMTKKKECPPKGLPALYNPMTKNFSAQCACPSSPWAAALKADNR